MNEDDLIEAVKTSYQKYKNHGARSNEKLKPLHNFFSKLTYETNNNLTINSISFGSNKEDKIEGKFYDKTVDISIQKDNQFYGAFAVKFVTSNYKQNANNYFENMLGETSNIKANEYFYIQILIIRNPLPYLEKEGELRNWETITDRDILKYKKLFNDIDDKQHFKPSLFFIKLYNIEEKGNEIFVKENYETLENTKDFYKKYSCLNDFKEKIKKLTKNFYKKYNK